MDGLITSRNNSNIKRARALWQRKHRQESGLFLVEGIRHVGEAVEAGAVVEAIFYAPDLLDSQFAHELIRTQSAAGLACIPTTAQVFASLAGKENPQGILAVVRQPAARLSDLNPEDFPWGVAAVAPQDPGNIGTLLRTIDAVGASGLLLLDDAADPYHPSAVRASMGALFWHPVVGTTFADFAAWARRQDYYIYGSSAHAGGDYRQVLAYHPPLILLLGSEREGLSAPQAAVCDELLKLPMHGRVTSLNLAIAAGVLLYDQLGKLEAGGK